MIEAEQLSKSFGSLRALDDVSFGVLQGEIFGLLGRNGSGKTTLIRILTGFRLPTSGRALVAGFDVVRRSRAARAQIGYVPETGSLYGGLSVRALLDFAARARGLKRLERRRAIDEVLTRFGLEPVTQRLVAHCSKGFRQRVALAQAVLHRPRIVFLDEPTSGLDPEQRVVTWDLIRSLAQETTVVMSSHNLREVSMLCARALVLDRGRIVRIGLLEELGGEAGITEIFRATADSGRQGEA